LIAREQRSDQTRGHGDKEKKMGIASSTRIAVTSLTIVPLVVSLSPCLLVSLSPCLGRADEPKPLKVDLRTLKGESVQGQLVSITGKEVVLDDGKEKVTVPSEQILQIDYRPLEKAKPGEKWIDVELSDGTLLRCKNFAPKGKEVALTLPGGQEVKVPLATIGNVLYSGEDEKARRAWNERLKNKGSQDVLVARSETGAAAGAVLGTFGDGVEDGTKIEFIRGSGQKVAFPLERVYGLIFVRELNPNAAPVVCKLIDAHRGEVMASKLESTPTGLKATTPSGAVIEYKADQLARLDYSRDKLAFLSNLEPVREVNPEEGGGFFRYRRNLNQNDKPLVVGTTTYPLGLSLHAHTELEYDLKGDYREFKAVAGIDPTVGGNDGPTVLKIYGDGKELRSLTMTRKDKEKAQPIELNIKDVKILKIVVTSGDLIDFGRHLNLADAKVSK
jgi:hypothetical protein